MTSSAQKAAAQRYKTRNAARQRYYVAKSTALRFVEMAEEADFEQLCARIEARRQKQQMGEQTNG